MFRIKDISDSDQDYYKLKSVTTENLVADRSLQTGDSLIMLNQFQNKRLVYDNESDIGFLGMTSATGGHFCGLYRDQSTYDKRFKLVKDVRGTIADQPNIVDDNSAVLSNLQVADVYLGEHSLQSSLNEITSRANALHTTVANLPIQNTKTTVVTTAFPGTANDSSNYSSVVTVTVPIAKILSVSGVLVVIENGTTTLYSIHDALLPWSVTVASSSLTQCSITVKSDSSDVRFQNSTVRLVIVTSL